MLPPELASLLVHGRTHAHVYAYVPRIKQNFKKSGINLSKINCAYAVIS